MVLGAPTEKVNAPATGCESAETARQATTYVPSARVGTSVAIVSLPPSWRIAPDVDRGAVAGDHADRVGDGSTSSLNVSTTWVGDVGCTAPDVGLVDTSSAWALAAPHVPSSPASVVSSASTAVDCRPAAALLRRRAPHAVGRASVVTAWRARACPARA